MKKVINFIKAVFFAFGFASYLLVLLDLITPYSVTKNFVRAIALIVVVISFLGTLIFKEGLSKKSLWIRRIIIISISCIITPAICILFGCINSKAFGGYFFYTTIITIITTIVTYILADKIEKRYLKEINVKLEKNINDNKKSY